MNKKAMYIRDTILSLLKKEQSFGSMVAAEINGCLISAADIALPNGTGTCEVFRIAVVPHAR